MQELRERIKKSKFQTQEKFAIETGINESVVSKYCRGLREPSKQHLEIIKKALENVSGSRQGAEYGNS